MARSDNHWTAIIVDVSGHKDTVGRTHVQFVTTMIKRPPVKLVLRALKRFRGKIERSFKRVMDYRMTCMNKNDYKLSNDANFQRIPLK